MQVIFKTWKKAFDSDGTRLDIYYLVTSTPIVADTNAASNTVSTAVACTQTIPVGLATPNEDKTPDGVKTGFYLDCSSSWTHSASSNTIHCNVMDTQLMLFSKEQLLELTTKWPREIFL